MKKKRHTAVLAVYLVLIKGGNVLLHLRQNSGYADGMYSLVAGHVEKGESIQQAMIRETKEEIGIDIDPDDMKLLTTIHRNAEDGARVDFFLGIDQWKGEIRNLEPFKCREVRFFSLNNLPDNLLDYVREAIYNSINSIPYSGLGWEE